MEEDREHWLVDGVEGLVGGLEAKGLLEKLEFLKEGIKLKVGQGKQPNNILISVKLASLSIHLINFLFEYLALVNLVHQLKREFNAVLLAEALHRPHSILFNAD